MTVKLSINNIKNTAFLFSRYKLYIDLEMYIDIGLRPRSRTTSSVDINLYRLHRKAVFVYYHFCILFGNVDWLKTGHMTFYQKWYSTDVTNYSNTHAMYTHCALYIHFVYIIRLSNIFWGKTLKKII